MNLGIFALVGVIMLVLAGASFGYLLQIRNKSRSSWMLLWFFLCIIFSSIATILTNTGTAWSWAFAPAQDALLILGGVFLVRFAYLYPADDQPGEARWVVRIFDLLALFTLGYASIFAFQYLASLPAQLEESRAYYLITPVTILAGILVFFRRSIHWSAKPMDSTREMGGSRGASIRTLLRPKGQPALALRNYGLALAIGLIPVIVTVTKAALPVFLASFLFNFGVVAAIAAIMLVYLSHAPEPTNITAKLIGISLVTVLLILGLASVLFILNTPELETHSTVEIFTFLVLLSSTIILIAFPQFFRHALLHPLNNLLAGVKQANEGSLDVQVEVQYEDEVGFLTRSFNRMVRSLSDATQTLKNESMLLETEVAERTAELSEINQRLITENTERKNAEERLDRQFRFQQALAQCSQVLLQTPQDEAQQVEILNASLAALLPAAEVGRAYIFHNFIDPEQGECFGILAEACAPDVPAHLPNPANWKVPWTIFPAEIYDALASNQAYGGLTEQAFASAPFFLEAFTNQQPPLLSVQFIPVFFGDQWWGFIGFDDVVRARQWSQEDILLLRTASEMVGSTLQRWQAEARLKGALEILEQRVEERTAELSLSNELLIEEIQHRQRTQSDLEGRLDIERQLSTISARLQEPAGIRENVETSLEALGRVMNAGRVFLVEFEPQASPGSIGASPGSIGASPGSIGASPGSIGAGPGSIGGRNQVREVFDWHRPDLPGLSVDLTQSLFESLHWIRGQLLNGETVYIANLAQLPADSHTELHTLQARGIESLVLSPMVFDKRIHGLLGCSNLHVSSPTVQANLRAFELVADMLKNLLQREYLIQTLEEQVAERTRQLTTFLDMAMLSDQALDLADLLQPTLVAISEIASCDACCIHIYSEDKPSLQLIAQRGIPLDSLEQLREIELDAEFTDWLENAEHYQALGAQASSPVFPDPFCVPGYYAFFATPLRAGGISQGLLSCFRLADIPFSPFQATIMAALGELLGIIVENYRLRIEAGELAAMEERQHLAREIHDAVSQSVYSLSLFARSANDALDAGDEAKLLSNLQDLENTSLQALREMRLLLYQLRETGEEGDIQTALETRFNQVEKRLGIQATYEIAADILLPVYTRHQLWRIITEALNNSLKHANAAHVHVQISSMLDRKTVNAGTLDISIQDDGIGFDETQDYPGMGLDNMRTRANALGGRLGITSTLGGGTCVSLNLPMNGLDSEKEDQEWQMTKSGF